MTLTQEILERDGYRCQYCNGKEGRADTVDHIIPKAELARFNEWERNDRSWMVAACHVCNGRKGTRRLVPMDFSRFDELPGTRPWDRWDGDPKSKAYTELLR